MPDSQHVDPGKEMGAETRTVVEATPRGDFPSYPIDLWAAWKAFRGLVRDKEDTRFVFAFFHAVNGRSYQRFFEEFAGSEYGQRIIADHEQLGRVLTDRAALEAHGPGTFAAAYLHYLDTENLSPLGVYEANLANAPEEMAAYKRDWPHLYSVSYMMNLTHDLYHVLTGYGRDPLGEALLLMWTGTQTNGRGPKWLGAMAGMQIRSEIFSWPVGRMMKEAKRLAREADKFHTVDLTALFPLPLEEARARLKVRLPELYRETLASWDGDMPVAVRA